MPASNPERAAMTLEERQNAYWQVGVIVILVGLPSLLCLLAVGRMNIAFATSWSDDPAQQIIARAGMGAATLFGAGMPVVWRLTHKTNPGLTLLTFPFWFACIGVSIGAGVWFLKAKHRPPLEAPAAAVLRDAKEIQKDLDGARAQLAKMPAHRPADKVDREILGFREQWHKLLVITTNCCDIETEQQHALCSEFSALERERKEAARAAGIEAKIAKLEEELSHAQAASAAVAAGHTEPPPIRLETYLTLMLEIAGAYGGMLIVSSAIAVLMTAKARKAFALAAQKKAIEIVDAFVNTQFEDEAKKKNWLVKHIAAAIDDPKAG